MKQVSLVAATLLATACSASLPTTPAVPAGTYRETFDDLRAGPFRRTFRVHVPQGRREEPLPLIVALHGAFSSAAEMERESGLSRLADREGFIVTYPNGYGFLGIARHWNSGHCCGPARASGTDDIAFIDRVIDHLSRRLPVDPGRIYVVGFSNGGMLAHRYAAERSDRLAGVAVVAGTIGGRPDTGEPEWRIPEPAAPVPLLVMHGSGDDRVPYDGTPPGVAEGRTWLPVAQAVAFWRRQNGASGLPEREDDGPVTRFEWEGAAKVALVRIGDFGHVWPARSRNVTASGFDAAELIWDFFSRLPVAGDPSLARTAERPSVRF